MRGKLMVLALAFAGLSAAQAQPASPARQGGENAATAYRAVWKQIGDDLNEVGASVSFVPTGLRLDTNAPAKDLEVVKRLLQQGQPVIRELIRASKLPTCDFGLKPVSGAGEKQMPALMEVSGSLRKSVRILRADAARAWGESDADGAVDRIAAIFGLAAQASHEPVVIISLTDAALISLAVDAVGIATTDAPGKALTAAQKKRLLDAINRLDRADPAGLVRARKAEADPDATTGQRLDAVQLRATSDVARARRKLE